MSEPDLIGPYEIRGTIGAGGMGVVYRGWDPRLNRTIAIKTLLPEHCGSDEARERFLREARAVAAISHPHVTQIYDIGDQDGTVYFAMEFLDGSSLEDLIREEGLFSPTRAISLIRQAAQGLKAAADRGIIHRDIKPSNLMLTRDGRLKITDFGLAKDLSGGDAGKSATLFGTANYFAPERASGAASDARADIYSLGATLYELVTGQPPFPGESAVEVLVKHVREPVPNPQTIRPDLPHSLSSLIRRMLAKRPEARPQNYELLLRELDHLPVGGRTSPEVTIRMREPIEPRLEVRNPDQRDRSRLAIFVIVGLLGMAAIGGWKQLSRADPEQQAVAGREKPTAAATTGQAPKIRPGSAATATTPATAALPGKTVRPRPGSPVKALLRVMEKSHEVTADGGLRIIGRVTNVGEARAAGGKVRVTLVNDAGEAVETTEVPLDPHIVEPGENSSFEAEFPDAIVGTQVRFELQWIS